MDSSPAPTETVSPVRDGSRRLPLVLCLLFSAGCLIVALWVWYDAQMRVVALKSEVAGQIIDNAKRNEAQATQLDALRNQLTSMNRVVGKLEAQHDDIHAQQIALADLYKDAMLQKDRRLIGDVEHLLMTANQALQLSADVRLAIRSLEMADAMLATSDNQPRYIALRRALAIDLEQLRAVPEIDVVGTAFKIDALIRNVDKLPMIAMSSDLAPAAAGDSTQQADDAPMWRKVLDSVWQEVRQLVEIRYLDRPDAALLSPEQAFFVRENLKLRLLGARLSLLLRKDALYHRDLETAKAIVSSYFDAESSRVASMIQTIERLDERHPEVPMPTLEASYVALKDITSRPAPQPPAPLPSEAKTSPIGQSAEKKRP